MSKDKKYKVLSNIQREQEFEFKQRSNQVAERVETMSRLEKNKEWPDRRRPSERPRSQREIRRSPSKGVMAWKLAHAISVPQAIRADEAG